MKKYLFSFTLIFIGIFGYLDSAQAATLNLISSSQEIFTGDEFLLSLNLDSETENINAGEIYLKIPENLEIKSVSSGNSIFNFWVKAPSAQENLISLSGGLTYPGFTGKNGELVNLIVLAKNPSLSKFSLLDTSQVLLNDGLGSKTTLALNPVELKIAAAPKNYTPKIYQSPTDTSPPTNLTITIGRSDTEYDGKWFASFQAQDPGSGIQKFEIAEIPKNQDSPKDTDWQTAKSPYILKNQNQTLKFYVKVTDNAGNFTVDYILHQAGNQFFGPAFKLAVIILVLLIIVLLLSAVKIKKWLLDQKQKKSASPPPSI